MWGCEELVIQASDGVESGYAGVPGQKTVGRLARGSQLTGDEPDKF